MVVWCLVAAFLCPLTANVYGIEFLAFSISDYDTKKVIFDVAR
jgi:protein unc-119